jgi:radical SAM protein with 4Fe4S-binding SPASM domain
LFNLGLANYINGKPRMLPCEAGSTNFFIYPYGDVFPCNGLEEKYWLESMGNIRDYSNFDELWNSQQSKKVREMVRVCPKNCWMVGTAAPVIKKYIWKTGPWVVKKKIASLFGKRLCIEKIPYFPVGQDSRQGNLSTDNVRKIADRNFEIKEVPIHFVGDFDEDNKLVAATDSSANQF